MKYRWIRDWFLYTDYTSGEMIRTWFQINGFHRLTKWWATHMRRRFREYYRKR